MTATPRPFLLRAMFGTLCPWGKFWLYLGLVSLAAAAGMSFMVGMKMTALHALFLACLSFVTAFIPEVAYRSWNEGRRIVSLSLALLAIPLFGVEFGQHAAYTAGIRGHDIATARVQNTKYDDARGNVADLSRQVTFWEGRVKTLTSQNQWAVTVTADALRGQLANLNLAIELEAKRGGCKQLCLARTKERDDVLSRIAIAEEVSSITKRLAEAKDKLAEFRAASAKTEHVSSQTEHMNAFLSKAVAIFAQGSIKPDEITSEITQQSANMALALAATGLPALALFVAGLYRREEEAQPEAPLPTTYAPAAPKPTFSPLPPVPTIQRPNFDLMVGRAIIPGKTA